MRQQYVNSGNSILKYNGKKVYPDQILSLDLSKEQDLNFFNENSDILIPFHIASVSAEILEISDKNSLSLE